MNLKQAAITVAIAGAVSVAGAHKASAVLVTVDCTSPTIDLNPPPAGTAVSSCGVLAPLPVGAVVTDVTLSSRYSVTLQIGAATGTAEMGHTTNVAASLRQRWGDHADPGHPAVHRPALWARRLPERRVHERVDCPAGRHCNGPDVGRQPVDGHFRCQRGLRVESEFHPGDGSRAGDAGVVRSRDARHEPRSSPPPPVASPFRGIAIRARSPHGG